MEINSRSVARAQPLKPSCLLESPLAAGIAPQMIQRQQICGAAAMVASGTELSCQHFPLSRKERGDTQWPASRAKQPKTLLQIAQEKKKLFSTFLHLVKVFISHILGREISKPYQQNYTWNGRDRKEKNEVSWEMSRTSKKKQMGEALIGSARVVFQLYQRGTTEVSAEFFNRNMTNLPKTTPLQTLLSPYA